MNEDKWLVSSLRNRRAAAGTTRNGKLRALLPTSVRAMASAACIGFAAVGCGGSPALSDGLGAAQYQARADTEQAKADAEQRKFVGDAVVHEERCVPARNDADVPCWTEDRNPTQSHLAAAERHRKAAAELRARSQTLRDAEARACAGLPDHDRDTSPFAHTQDIVDIQPIDVRTESGMVERGAVFTFGAVAGMSVGSLQRLLDCQLARNEAMGHAMTDMDSCPLVASNVTATVRPAPAGFAVVVTSVDKTSVAEIMRRADALKEQRVSSRQARVAAP